MASAASRHRSSRIRRPVMSTPIGNPVASSRPHPQGASAMRLEKAARLRHISRVSKKPPEDRAPFKPLVAAADPGSAARRRPHVRVRPLRDSAEAEGVIRHLGDQDGG
jgi:hypothetical protein